MFVLVQKLIYATVPTQAPWLVRPFVSFLFNKLTTILVDPQITRNAEMVSYYFKLSLHLLSVLTKWISD